MPAKKAAKTPTTEPTGTGGPRSTARLGDGEQQVAGDQGTGPEPSEVNDMLASDRMKALLEEHLAAAKAPAAGYELQQQLTRAASAIEEGRYEECIALSTAVVQADKNVLAGWENLGTCYFAKGEYALSLESWETAVALEKNPARRSVLRGYLASIGSVLKRPKPPPAPAAQARPGASPAEIQRLYGEGIDQYSAGSLDKAKRLFERVLELDPDHVKAAKALKRVKEEMAPQ